MVVSTGFPLPAREGIKEWVQRWAGLDAPAAACAVSDGGSLRSPPTPGPSLAGRGEE